MKQTSWLAFSIDRQLSTPVFEQICQAIRKQAASGDLEEGTRLPPTRVFATELGVSRSTVVTAYEQLVAEGYLQSVQGSGYTACSIGVVELNEPIQPPIMPAPETKPATARPFKAGQPDMRLFPHKQWAKAVSRVCRTNPENMLLGATVQGNAALRQAVADHVSEWRGIKAAPHQIFITAGAGDALEICIKTLTRSGATIGLENPGYLPLHSFVKDLGLTPTYLNIGPQGAGLPGQNCKAKLVVLTPSHQYPLGGAMSPSRRLEFIQWAQAQSSWIIEDDYDSEFRYAGRPIPAMAGFDQLNRTIYVGSFSKIFSNSLRLGYLIVPEGLIEQFRATLARTGVKASYMPQQALAEFIETGEFYRHLRRMRRIYGERRKFLLDRLTHDFAQFGSFDDRHAGMQVVFHLNKGISDKEVSQKAEALGLVIQPLSRFANELSDLNGLLLGYCGFTEDELGVALQDLLRILEPLRNCSASLG